MHTAATCVAGKGWGAVAAAGAAKACCCIPPPGVCSGQAAETMGQLAVRTGMHCGSNNV